MRSPRVLVALLLSLPLLVSGCSGDDVLQPSTGSLTVITSTTGDTPDPDGYTLQIDGGAPQAIGASAQVEAEEIAAGAHTVTLAGVAGNCSVAEGLSQSVTVDPRVVTVARFSVTCSDSGALRISTETSGSLAQGAGFSFSLDGGASQPIGPNASVTLSGLTLGAHTVTLQDLPSGCGVSGQASQSISISPNATASVSFSIICRSSDGFRWTSIPLPSGTTASIGWFEGRTLWGSSPSDLFVAGQTSGNSRSWGIWHYDGIHWTQQVSRTDTVFHGIWGFSANEVYAVGNRAGFDLPHPTAVLHYDGASWSDVSSSIPEPSVANAIWGPASNQMFLAGFSSAAGDSTSGLAASYDGAHWSRMTMPVFGVSVQLTDVGGSSGTDLWGIGSREKCDDCEYTDPIVLHYDGERWELSLTPDDHPYNDELTGLWVTAQNDVWISGKSADGTAIIWHYNGGSWSRFEPLGNDALGSGLQDIWASSSSDVYAVGPAVLLHFDGTIWEKLAPDGGDRVWGTSRNDVFVLRANMVYHGQR